MFSKGFYFRKFLLPGFAAPLSPPSPCPASLTSPFPDFQQGLAAFTPAGAELGAHLHQQGLTLPGEGTHPAGNEQLGGMSTEKPGPRQNCGEMQGRQQKKKMPFPSWV